MARRFVYFIGNFSSGYINISKYNIVNNTARFKTNCFNTEYNHVQLHHGRNTLIVIWESVNISFSLRLYRKLRYCFHNFFAHPHMSTPGLV
jgi:hypothetical protein